MRKAHFDGTASAALPEKLNRHEDEREDLVFRECPETLPRLLMRPVVVSTLPLKRVREPTVTEGPEKEKQQKEMLDRKHPGTCSMHEKQHCEAGSRPIR